jgi:hypothetical protein
VISAISVPLATGGNSLPLRKRVDLRNRVAVFYEEIAAERA